MLSCMMTSCLYYDFISDTFKMADSGTKEKEKEKEKEKATPEPEPKKTPKEGGNRKRITGGR